MGGSWGNGVVLVDHRGRLWREGDPALARMLGGRLTGAALARYAVLNLGFVSVTPGERFIRVACRPSIIEPPAIVSTLHLAHDDEAATIGLDYFTRDWNHIIIRDRAKLRRLLSGLSSDTRCGNAGGRFLRKRIDGRASPHRSKVGAARRIFASATSLDDTRKPLDKLFGGRWSLHEVDAETGHTIVRRIGESYTPFNPAWLSRAIGSSLCSYADEGYGLWIAEHHHEALGTDAPLFDEIDAVLEFPSIGPARACYSRLALAVTVPGETRLVLSAAVTDSSIDLRTARVHKGG